MVITGMHLPAASHETTSHQACPAALRFKARQLTQSHVEQLASDLPPPLCKHEEN